MNLNFDFGDIEDNSGPYVFVSYRRADSKQFVARLYEQLAKDFHESKIFVDTRSIGLAERFDDVIERKVKACKVLIVVIGSKWLTITDSNGQHRLFNSDDWVRREITTALSQNTYIIPVLIDSTTMPKLEDLPDEIQPLCRWQAIEVNESCFDYHMKLLRNEIQKTIPFRDRLLDAYHEGRIDAYQVKKLSAIPPEHQEEFFERALMQAPILQEIEQDTRAQRLNEIIAALKRTDVSRFRCTCVFVTKAEDRIEIVLDCAILLPKSSFYSSVLSKGWIQNESGRYSKTVSYRKDDRYNLAEHLLVDIAGEIITANGFAGVGVGGVYVSYPLDNHDLGDRE